MNNHHHISGFTLIELMVVISIGMVLLLFSFPMLNNISLFSDSSNHLGKIIYLIEVLKKRAVQENVDFSMHMEPGSGIIWVTNEGMDDDGIEEAKDSGFQISEDIAIIDVEFPGTKGSSNKEYQIRFRKQGYSDFAMIHVLLENEENKTLKIEPFLSKVQLFDKDISLEDCN